MTQGNSISSQILEFFIEKDWSFCFAESCTGGLASARVTRVPGISHVFKGSVVAYANSVKTDLLGVPAALITSKGAVSQEVAEGMARGARQRLQCDWSVAMTGIAGPDGGTPGKPVGTVCFAVSGPGVEHQETRHFQGDREQIQDQAADHALHLLWKFATTTTGSL